MDSSFDKDFDPANGPAHDSSFGADQAGIYQFRLRGKLRPAWSKWFFDLTMTDTIDADGRPVIVMTGYLADQAALHGVIERVRDTGLQLLSVDLLESGPDDAREPAPDAGE